jgi:tRNA dimethylallyltransferase
MKKEQKPEIITLLGPTASGKTHLSVRLAAAIDGQIISADSRQVYRGMSLGTGKDLAEYSINGENIPYYLIDIADPGYEYSVFEFSRDFRLASQQIKNSGCTPILCGGTGLYLDAILRGYNLSETKPDAGLRQKLETKSNSELIEILAGMRDLHNSTDIGDRNRLIRAIEIAIPARDQQPAMEVVPVTSLVLGLRWERDKLRERITERLHQRLEQGMAGEVSSLIDGGIEPQKLIFYGLEYKFLTLYVTGKISFNEMFTQLNTGIHQFAKRQMTWFRRMERKGIVINWLQGEAGEDLNFNHALEICNMAGFKNNN